MVLLCVVANASGAMPTGARAEALEVEASLVCSDADAVTRLADYEAFLRSDPKRFARELATLEQLRRSDVRYVVRIGGVFEPGVEGSLTTDGERIFVSVAGGCCGASLNSRLAHELEHARQFDDGEIAFSWDAATRSWRPAYSSYDIGDEVLAWQAQLRTALPLDYWRVTSRDRKPTLLQLFSQAETDDARAAVLVSHGYVDRNPVAGSIVAFPARFGFRAGQMVRPSAELAFFGRVHGAAASAS